MRKKLILLFAAVAFCILGNNALNAQNLKTYNWASYGVSFGIPNTHEIKKNTADEFESGDSKTWLQMFPYKDINETAKGMIAKVVSQGGYKILEEGEYTSGGYNGYWVECSSAEYPGWSYWLIGFIDPSSETNFYSIIWWKTDDKTAYDIAYKMSYSFKKI